MKVKLSSSLILLSILNTAAFAKEQKVSKTIIETKVKTPFERFSERLKISYFGFLTTPPARDISKGRWKNAAISPSLGVDAEDGHTNHDTWPTNVWNQISFNYNYGSKLSFVVNPRILVPLAHPVSMKPPEDRSFIAIEDVFTGFQGMVFESVDKKFNFFNRFGLRLPTSRLSRNSNNAGFGRISQQIEYSYNPTYDFSKTWQISLLGTIRYWVYQDRYNLSRLRFYTAPYIQYSLNDTTRFLVYYENMIENNKRWKSINNKKPVYKDIVQNVLVGISKDLSSKLTLFPFMGVYVDDVPFSTESIWFGSWISYKIK